MKNTWRTAVALAIVATSIAAGCSDDEAPGTPEGGTAGSAGSDASAAGAAGGAGVAGGGGAAGSDGGGTAGTAGTAGADGGGAAGSAGTDGGPPAGPVDPTTIVVVGAAAADGGSPPARLLVAGTDFATTTEIASVDPTAKSVVGRVSVADGDAVPAASGGIGFVIERTNDRVDVLDAAGAITSTIDVGAAPSGSATNQQKAYVTLYGANRVAVLDLAAAKVARSVDLSAYLDASDADGAVDVDNAVLDAGAKRLYVTLGRIDRTTITAPDFHLACPTGKSKLVRVDTDTDAVVDALDLALVDPVSVAFDAGANRLLVAAAGCYDSGAGTRSHAGVESLDLATGTTSVLWQPTADDFVNRLIQIGSSEALLDRFDSSFVEHWTDWQLASAGPGTELAGVPGSPSFDGSGGLFGAETQFGDAGSSTNVVLYDIATQTSSVVVADPWQSGVTSSAGTALVR